MTLEDVREYEGQMQRETNERLRREQKPHHHQQQQQQEEDDHHHHPAAGFVRSASVVDQRWDAGSNATAADALDAGPTTPTAATTERRGWFSWSW